MLGAPIARGTNYIAQALVGRKPRSTKPFGRRLEVLAAAKKKSVKKPVDGDKAAEAEYAARTARRITGTTNGWSMRQQLNAVRQMKKVSVRSHLISFLHVKCGNNKIQTCRTHRIYKGKAEGRHRAGCRGEADAITKKATAHRA
eukprot:3958318-Pyramimonas_sp.AAC.1